VPTALRLRRRLRCACGAPIGPYLPAAIPDKRSVSPLFPFRFPRSAIALHYYGKFAKPTTGGVTAGIATVCHGTSRTPLRAMRPRLTPVRAVRRRRSSLEWPRSANPSSGALSSMVVTQRLEPTTKARHNFVTALQPLQRLVLRPFSSPRPARARRTVPMPLLQYVLRPVTLSVPRRRSHLGRQQRPVHRQHARPGSRE